MKATVARRAPLAAVAALIILGASFLTLTACNGDDADDWVVIHANRAGKSSIPGGDLDLCKMPAGKEASILPGCMFIEQGDKIGFANYYNDNEGGQQAKVEFNATVFGVSEITLDYQETKVLEVVQTPSSFFQMKITIPSGDHGGPVMIPKPPGGGDYD